MKPVKTQVIDSHYPQRMIESESRSEPNYETLAQSSNAPQGPLDPAKL